MVVCFNYDGLAVMVIEHGSGCQMICSLLCHLVFLYP